MATPSYLPQGAMNPAPTYGNPSQEQSTYTPETLFQRLRRTQGLQPPTGGTTNSTEAANSFGAQTKPVAPSSGTSSVTPTGRIAAGDPAPAPQPSRAQETAQWEAQRQAAWTAQGNTGQAPPQVGTSTAPTLQPAQPTAPQPTAPQPTSPDPFTAMGGGFWTGQQWVPRDHPLATQAQAAPTAGQPQGAPLPGGGGVMPQLPGMPPGATYTAGQLDFNPQIYQGAQFNVPIPQAYQAGQLSQWQTPNQQALEGQQTALLNQMYSQGFGLPTAQLKEQQKEAALAMQRQLGEQQANQFAARGLSGPGMADAAQRGLAQNTMSQILSGYRDTDIQSELAKRDQQAQLAGLTNDVLAGQFGRQSQGYQNTLAGQTAQQTLLQRQADDQFRNAQLGFDVQRAGADEGYRGFQSRQDAEEQLLAAQQAQEQLRQAQSNNSLQQFAALQGQWQDAMGAYNQGRSLDLQGELGRGGLSLDQNKLSEQARQFDQGYGLDLARFLDDQRRFGVQFPEQQRQFNQQLGLGYNTLNANSNQNTLNSILQWL